MSTDRETTRIVRSWLEEGVTTLPDRVLDTVLDQVPATPQRRSWWPPRRFFQMSKLLPIAGAAAVVLVVALIGYNLLPGTAGPGHTLAPTATAPTPTATSTGIGPPPSGSITPGTYAWSWAGGQLAFDVPAGWTAIKGGLGLGKNVDEMPEVGLESWFPGSGYEVTHVYTDACHSAGALEPVGPEVADLVAALDDQLNTDATVSDGRLEGAKRIDLVPAPGLDRASCRHEAEGPVQIWADPAETNYFALAPGYSGFAYVVDVGGTRLVVAGNFGGDASEADIAELDAMVDSFRIQP